MILDTCALLWIAGGEHSRMSKKTLDEIEKVPAVNIVSVTGFEIGLRGR